ncbi:DUF3048 domain-containing protein [Kitasatospora sp. MBT63]|uniref:DUF3048 domain-containing protein n=1 Tax=Kitasatospora sp. MBT63 TaxID=1444768 RepID=UPI0009E800AE|nr:DUF3048 domain-containing protein [Kitasatospora sp. MBT63]
MANVEVRFRMMNVVRAAQERWRSSSRRVKAGVIAAAVAVAGTAIAVPLAQAGGSKAVRPVAASGPSPNAGPATPTAPPATDSGLSPLTGLPGGGGHLLAVKIDNVGQAQYQQAGLNSADVVYAIQVEGGLSRYLAVFDSEHAPASVGPVRSARQSDIPLLAAYGKVGLAYSGAISGLRPDLAQANLQGITPSSGLFSRGGSSPTFIRPASVFSAYPDLAQAKNVGFTFGDAPGGGVPAATASARMPAASFTFTASGASWLVSVDGHPANTTDQGRATTSNVIVQHVPVVPGKYTDHNAGRPDNEVFSQTTGEGSADFYRDGQVWHGKWSKSDDSAPTQYTVGGAPMPLKTGRTWIVLAP